MSKKCIFALNILISGILTGTAFAGNTLDYSNDYNSYFVTCSGMADSQYSPLPDPRQFYGEVKGSDKEWSDFFAGCMASRGHKVNS